MVGHVETHGTTTKTGKTNRPKKGGWVIGFEKDKESANVGRKH